MVRFCSGHSPPLSHTGQSNGCEVRMNSTTSLRAARTFSELVITTMPSETWKNNLGSALLEYAQGTGTWDGVKTAFVDGWATEYAAAQAK